MRRVWRSQRVLRRPNRLTNDWSISGATRFATGFPVTLLDNSDHSLLGKLGNGVNNNCSTSRSTFQGRSKPLNQRDVLKGTGFSPSADPPKSTGFSP